MVEARWGCAAAAAALPVLLSLTAAVEASEALKIPSVFTLLRVFSSNQEENEERGAIALKRVSIKN